MNVADFTEVHAQRGYYRVESNGMISRLIDDEWPITLCSQPAMPFEQCMEMINEFINFERDECYVLTIGNGKARVLFFKQT